MEHTLLFINKLVLILSIQINHFPTPTNGIRLRCKSTFLFDRHNKDNNEVYQKAWSTPCSPQLRKICNKTVTLSYMEMQPFTSRAQINKTIWAGDGLLQQIISVALAECCGNCINIKYRYMHNRTELISINNKNNSDILLPIFSQGQLHQFNSTLPMMNIPIIQLTSAMFIIKSSISATLFAREVAMAIIDIWPLLGVAILMAFAAGVAIWIIDTWWNKEHFPRRFVTGAFEGKSLTHSMNIQIWKTYSKQKTNQPDILVWFTVIDVSNSLKFLFSSTFESFILF